MISDDETTVERIDTLADTDTRLDPEHAATTEAKDKFRGAFARCPSASARSPSCSTSRT